MVFKASQSTFSQCVIYWCFLLKCTHTTYAASILLLQGRLFWILKIGDSGMKICNNWLHSQAFQNPWIFFTKFTMVTEIKQKKQPFSQKGIVKVLLLELSFPINFIPGSFVGELNKQILVSWCTQLTVLWLVWNFLFKYVYSFVVVRKKGWNCK